MTLGVLCSIVGKEVNIAMVVIRVTVVLHEFDAAPDHSRRRHDVQVAMNLIASQVACLRRTSLSSLPTSVRLLPPLFLHSPLSHTKSPRLERRGGIRKRIASKKNEIWKWLMNGGRVTPRHLGVVLAGVSKDNQFSP